MVALVVSMVTSASGTSAANVALPDISQAFGGSFSRAQWVVLGYLLAVTGGSVMAGALGDAIGRARLLNLGALLWTAAAVVCALAPSFGTLVAARGVQGIAGAVMMTMPLAIARDEAGSRGEGTGAVMGLLGTSNALGVALGPVVGGIAANFWGWRAVFMAMVPFGLATLLLARVLHNRSVKDSRADSSRGLAGFDWQGALLLGFIVTAASLGMTGLQHPQHPGVIPGLFGVAALALVGFIIVESRATHPVLPGALLQVRPVGSSTISNLVVGAVMMATLIAAPFYLSGALGLSPLQVGFAMMSGPLVSVVSGVFAGRMVDRHGPGGIVAIGLVGMLIGTLMFTFLPPMFGLVGYLAGAISLAPGYQLFLAGNNTQVLLFAPEKWRGTASGVLSLSRNLGLIAGTSLLGGLFALLLGWHMEDATRAELDWALRGTFLVAAALLLITLILVVLDQQKIARSKR